MLKRWQFVWLAVAAVMFCVTVPLYARHHPLPIALWAYFLTRLPIVLLLIYWGLRRRTLTTWIFVSILLGIMLGHDLPALAVSLAAAAAETLSAPPESAGEMILRAFPENIAKAIAEGQVLQIVVFSVLFGIGLALVREERRRPLLALGESLSETMFKFTNLV